jgi:hypothetical protein
VLLVATAVVRASAVVVKAVAAVLRGRDSCDEDLGISDEGRLMRSSGADAKPLRAGTGC